MGLLRAGIARREAMAVRLGPAHRYRCAGDAVLRPPEALMPVLDGAAREVVTSGRLAHLVTVNPDGSPQVSLVWVGLDGDEIVCAHLGQGQKLRNVQRDARVALSMEAEGRNPVGLDHYLLVYGTARVTAGGGPELLQRLAGVYLGPGIKFPPFDDPPPGHVIHIAPERVGGVGPWAPTG